MFLFNLQIKVFSSFFLNFSVFQSETLGTKRLPWLEPKILWFQCNDQSAHGTPSIVQQGDYYYLVK